MANGNAASRASPSSREKRLARRLASPVQEKPPSPEGAPSSPKSTPAKRLRSSSGSITRQVSHDGLSDNKADGKLGAASVSGRGSPVRCVSEFDKVTSVGLQLDPSAKESIPFLPNPLHHPSMLDHHAKALRLEAELHPMRLILSRLMANLTFNRRGLFNVPVDPVALGLPDYFAIIKQPMDLGTVKKRLHSLEYKSRRECAEEIRLCFRNAMKYNPPNNIVHSSAKELVDFFEDQIRSFCPELAVPAPATDHRGSNGAPPAAATKPSMPATLSAETLQPGDGAVGNAPAAAQNLSTASVASFSSDTYTLCHALGTRKSTPAELLAPSISTMVARKRRKRGAKVSKDHNCQWCRGSTCAICNQGCLSLEPTLLICNGPQCVGAKVRKGATYYVAPDGSCIFCQRCHAGLSAVLPHANKLEDESICRYKRDLLKRKNDEEVVESWLNCSQCHLAVHRMCAMHNPYAHNEENYLCPSCVVGDKKPSTVSHLEAIAEETKADVFTFITGSELPVAMSDVADLHGSDVLGASSLPETPLSSFIEEKVRERMGTAGIPNAEKTVVVRVISDCDRFFKVPEVVRTHFHMHGGGAEDAKLAPPLKVHYRSKAIAMFQKFDGLDVCIFCMYVQEYDGVDDEFECESDKAGSSQKRVYVAYIDSVEYFRPRTCRTEVYHEVLSAYLATARKRGYETAHIWACPPLRGNSFVFWNHPAAQRTPNMERLTAWYHEALSRSIDCGIVTDVKSLYETDFEDAMQRIEEEDSSGAPSSITTLPCPPLLDGDFWIEEAVRVHGITIDRYSREKSVPDEIPLGSTVTEDEHDPCPAIQIAALLRDKIIALPSAIAFRRPVNAAALKLKDYHSIISKPMDLGTVNSRCALGEYHTLAELVSDVDLVFSNAKKYNPPGHIVHQQAIEVADVFETELDRTTKAWVDPSARVGSGSNHSWRVFSDMSMSLNRTLKHFDGLALVEQPLGTESTDPVAMEVAAGSAASVSSTKSGEDECGLMKAVSATPEKRVDLHAGPEAVLQRMVGSDSWLLDKNPSSPPKWLKKLKRKKSGGDSLDEPAPKRRRQSWLGEEVGTAVRKMRTSFFKCSLIPKLAGHSDAQLHAFNDYAKSFKARDKSLPTRSSRTADARHALLEFSQFRNFEFDTLRRAKYSSAMLLYHLHNDDAPGLVPECTSCHRSLEGVRWHRIVRVVERRPALKHLSAGRKPSASNIPFVPEELCSSCHSKHHLPDQFIPLQVSIQE